MTFADFLATYSLDRLEFGDSTKYIYESIYEVFEGKKIDLTPIDELSMVVFDSELLEDNFLTEEIINEIDAGNLPQVLSKNEQRLNWINDWIGEKVTSADTAYFKKIVNQTSIPSNVQDKWINQMLKTNPGASKTIWSKIKNVFGKYSGGEYSAKFAANAEAAKNAMTGNIANINSPGIALTQMKTFLSKGASWLLNPAHFSTIAGSVGGIMAFYLLLRVLKRRRIKRAMRKQQEAALYREEYENNEILTEEQENELKTNLKTAKELSKKYKEINRVFNGLTIKNCPVIDY